MPHTIRHQKKLLSRVRKIAGQTKAVENALLAEAECIKILQQVAAIKGAVNGLMLELLEGEIREHLSEQPTDLTNSHNDTEQVIAILRSYLK
ncbi:metal/formaldehyde-sensitive transcriptional repressor [Neisseria sp. Ec49-e6-T10]|uniref:metal/formaldehyde-sensitive transcriptional repressor n=1 Tax=Neisseria sp. Ec49-e6-T10 TaxID=3140744 RepID=UPI003EB8289D